MLHVADQRRNENEKLAILVGSLFRFRSICVQMFNTIFRITIITAHEKGGNKDELQREDSDKCQMGC